jgi:arylsulfatase A-like enzyme
MNNFGSIAETATTFPGQTGKRPNSVASVAEMLRLSKDPNYHFMADMTNKAIDWLQYQKSLTPDKPFFIYFAPGATHAPHLQLPRPGAIHVGGQAGVACRKGDDPLRVCL